jgi:hypothetical protein
MAPHMDPGSAAHHAASAARCAASGEREMPSRQQPLARHMVELEPYAIGILEQDRVSRRPLVLARRADDFCAERLQEAMQLIDVGAFAGAEAEVMQADALLFERGACALRRRRADCRR